MRSYLFELLARFKAQTGNEVVIYIVRQEPVFHAGEVFDLLELALYITGVFKAYLRLIAHAVPQLRTVGVKWRKLVIAELRAADEIGERHSGAHLSRAAGAEKLVELRARRYVCFLKAGYLAVYLGVFS